MKAWWGRAETEKMVNNHKKGFKNKASLSDVLHASSLADVRNTNCGAAENEEVRLAQDVVRPLRLVVQRSRAVGRGVHHPLHADGVVVLVQPRGTHGLTHHRGRGAEGDQICIRAGEECRQATSEAVHHWQRTPNWEGHRLVAFHFQTQSPTSNPVQEGLLWGVPSPPKIPSVPKATKENFHPRIGAPRNTGRGWGWGRTPPPTWVPVQTLGQNSSEGLGTPLPGGEGFSQLAAGPDKCPNVLIQLGWTFPTKIWR